ncbi:hypothetical protein F8388_022204 [Cannabis sativa]|uniref:TF-B3 domain-containing protein n=1 Tax=Cannabis sativa TaxID=3483 RepID=A0A7J6G8B8_CANSA|nr:hypothetical protein F8388_022204 [Cannabis sativa]
MEKRTNLRRGNEVKLRLNQFLQRRGQSEKQWRKGENPSSFDLGEVLVLQPPRVEFINVAYLENQTTRLPQKFVRLHRETLASSVSVVLPCSHTWKLGLVVEDDKLYLKEGWPEFVKHYQLAYGHLLDFTYVGSSNFNIAIYDKTTCEIDYSPFSSPNFTNEESDSENEDMPKKCEAEDQLWMKRNRRRNQGPYNTYRHSKAVIEARRFYSEYPHFYRVIRTDKHNRYKQQLPKKFIESHVGVKSEAVTLEVGSKEWSVNIEQGLRKELDEDFLAHIYLPIHHCKILRKHQYSVEQIERSFQRARHLQCFQIYWHAGRNTKLVVSLFPTLGKFVRLPLLPRQFRLEQLVSLCSQSVSGKREGGLPRQH